MSENIFLKKFKSKSDAELEQIIIDKNRFVEQATIAAIEILKERNTKSEITTKAENEIKAAQEKKRTSQPKVVEKKEKINFVTNDPDAPKLHSKLVVTIFSAIFSTIFGAALLMKNLSETGNSKARIPVLVFGILYTLATILIIELLNIHMFAVVLNFGGAEILTSYFWNKHIGKETKYRKRSWVKPAIISIVISIPFLLAFIFAHI